MGSYGIFTIVNTRSDPGFEKDHLDFHKEKGLREGGDGAQVSMQETCMQETWSWKELLKWGFSVLVILTFWAG